MTNLKTLDPRIKLLILAVASTLAVVSSDIPRMLALLALVLIVLLLGGVGPSPMLRQTRHLLGMIGAIFLLQCLFVRGGAPLLSAGGLTLVTVGGLETAALVAIRLVIILLSALIVLTGDSRDYLLALTQIKVPYEIAFMVLAALRFIPLIRQQATDVLYAVQMRGVRLKKTSLRNKAAVYISVMVPIAAGAIRRSEQMSIAMEARGFRALPCRSSMRSLRLKARDLIYAAVFLVLAAAIVVFL